MRSLIGLLAILIPGRIQAAVPIQVSVPQAQVQVGQTLSVPVSITSPAGVDIFAVQLEINYDAAVLQATGISLTGTAAAGWAVSSNLDEPGILTLSLASSRRLAQGGTLVNLQFLARGAAGSSSSLHFDSLMLNEGDPEAVSQDGAVAVVSPPPPPPSTPPPSTPETPPPPPPVPQAGFSVSPSSGVAPLTVQVSNTSSNAASYEWSFPGGTSNAENPPAQTFSQPGTYTIRLVARSSAGQSSETSRTVSVYTRAQAAFSASRTKVLPGSAVTFTDASTGDISTRLWNFGDGQTSAETSPSHGYALAGTYTVSLTVSGNGGTSTATKANLIEVGNKAPVISPAIPGFTAVEGADLAIDLSAYETDDLDGAAALSWSAAVVSGASVVGVFNTNGGAEDQFLFKPAPFAFGEVRVRFTLNDSQGANASQEVVLTWTSKADPPVVADPAPADRATGIAASILLRWTATDPDPGDVLSFEVRVGKANPPTTVSGQGLKQPSLLLTGLDQRSTYFWQVLAKDSFGLTTQSPVWRFTTVADEEAPAIVEGPVAVGITIEAATVQWRTNEASTSLVEYSVNANMSPFQQASDATLAPDHSVTLAGLTAGLTYYYRVSSRDAAGNLSATKGGQFKTLAVEDLLPPKILKGPVAQGLTTEEATVQWTTDEASTSVVEYSTEGNPSGARLAGDASLAIDHSVTLTGLSAGTTYFYRISSEDASKNLSATRAGQFKTLKVLDILPPKIIRGPAVQGITTEGATVQWSTDEASTSVVEYGATPALGQVAQDPSLVTGHTLVLTGLEGNTTYYYRVSSTDASENQGVSPQGSFKTLALADILSPVILVGPNATGITQSQATIRWTTDEISNSRVEFGLQDNLSAVQEMGNGDMVLVHVVSLTNLEPKGTYSYRVSSVDVSGNISAVKSGSFKTLAAEDLIAPKIVSGPVLAGLTDQGVQIEWRTNEDADALVEFGAGSLDQGVTNPELQRRQSVSLTNLLPATTYSYRISYADQSGNRSVSAQFTFTTAAVPDLKPPVIKAGPVISARLDDQVVVEWTTDENSDSEVLFGPTATYGSAAGSADMVAKHSVSLVNLTPGTTYHYQVRSKDSNGNGPVSSGNRTFTTREAPDNIPPKITGVPGVAERTDVSATIVWKTDELADGFVECTGENGDQQLGGSEEGSLNHVVGLTNLTPGITYRCGVQSTDVAGNGPTAHPGGVSFTTRVVKDVLPPVIQGNPFVVSATSTGAIIRWVTDEPADSRVYFGAEGEGERELVNPEDVTTHTLELSNLVPGTAYSYRVGSVDASDNGPVQSRGFSFKTAKIADVLPPVLTGGPTVRSVTATTAMIEWVTNEPSSTVLDFGTSLSYEGGRIELGDLVGLHQVLITNLQSGTTYRYKVTSTDGSGNTFSSSRDHTFRTLREADKFPPNFLEGPVVFRSDEGAVIQWTTDEPAGYEVVFDSDPGLGSSTREVIQNSELNEKQAARISRLQRGKRYFYQVRVWDQDGNTRAAGNSGGGRAAKLAQVGASFVTLLEPDVKAPVLLAVPRVSAATATTLTIEWDTDEASDSIIEFGAEGGELDQEVGSPLAVTRHQVVLTNLVPGQAYTYRVHSTDISGNGPTQSPLAVTKTKAEVDLTPPVIEENPQLTGLANTWATIEWRTDELSTSVVEYGVGELETRREDPTLTRQHRITLTNLSADIPYRYRVSSSDAGLNGPTTTEALTFRTQALADLAAPSIVGEPRVLTRTNVRANLAWDTDELSDSFVKYGTSAEALDLAAGSAAPVTEHRIALTNLTPLTTYFYQVSSIDRNNNGPTESAVYQFTTAEFQDTTPPAVPADVLARAGSESAWLSWTPSPDADLAGYNIYRREVLYPRRLDVHQIPPPFQPVFQLPEERFQLVATLVQEPRLLDKGLQNGKLYDYRITALDNAFPPNESAVSKVVQILPLKSKAIVAPLAGTVVSNPLVTTLEVFNVSSLSRNALTYMFQVATDSAFANLVATTGRVRPATGPVTAWTFNRALEKGQAYWWRARANDGVFDGLWMEPARFSVTGVAGDFSGDEAVSFDDFFLFADQFGRRAGRSTWNPRFDLSGNGVIDFDDFFLLADHFGEGQGASKMATQVAAGSAGSQVRLRVSEITARSVALALDLGQAATPRGYGLVLRYPRGAAIEDPGPVAGEDQGEVPSTLGGILRQTEEGAYVANYDLRATSAPRTGTEILLHFNLPSGFTDGEIRLEELWTVDDNRQIRRFATDSRVRLVPQAYSLASPYPNPFNPEVQIPYSLPERAAVKLQVYNILGQQVQTLVNETQEAGFYQLAWQGMDDQGEPVASGLYFIHFEAGAVSKIQKVVLMK